MKKTNVYTEFVHLDEENKPKGTTEKTKEMMLWEAALVAMQYKAGSVTRFDETSVKNCFNIAEMMVKEFERRVNHG